MWLFTEDGFYSAVRETHGHHRGEIVVRARRKDDLERFVKRFGTGSKIHTTGLGEFRDYGYRIWLTEDAFALAMGELAKSIGYSNFKSRVLKTLGGKREHMLHSVWSIMAKLQPGGAYGVGGRRGAQLEYVLDEAAEVTAGEVFDYDWTRARLEEAFDAGTVTEVRSYMRGEGQLVTGYKQRRKRRRS